MNVLRISAYVKLDGAIERAKQSEMVKSRIQDQSLSQIYMEGVHKNTDGTNHNNRGQQQQRIGQCTSLPYKLQHIPVTIT